jgi:LysR family transcriptional regulator, nitrogen assimilation regulatory protein
MDIRQLRYFLGVVEAKSLSKASGQLHVAQPALGVHIRNLERELGARLLNRHARGMAPTEAGRILARHASQLMRQFDRAREDLIDYATRPSGRVILCVGRSVPRIVVAVAAERCRKRYPEIRLGIVEGWRQHVNGPSEEADADLVITFLPHKNSQFVSEPLVQDELVLVYSSKNVRLPREIDFHILAERMLILPSEVHFSRRLVNMAAELEGRDLKVYCDMDSLEATKELVVRGVADTILPIASVREDVKDAKLRTAKIKNHRLQRTLCMLQSARHSRSSAIDLVSREIRSLILEFARDDSFGWKKVA